MDKIVFIVQDNALGGGTSSLSSLYNNIKDQYEIEVYQLTDCGEMTTPYSSLVKRSSVFCSLYFSSYALQHGWKKILSLFVKLLSRIFPNIINISVRKFEREHKSVQCVIAFGEGPAADFTSRIRSLRKITWIHYDITYYSPSHNDLVLYSKFDQIVCVSHRIAEGMKKMYPSISEHIIGIHNFIDEQRVTRLAKESVGILDEDLFNRKYTIISIGRICAVKRFNLIPEIASKLKDSDVDFNWIILGPANDLSEWNKLQHAINEFNVSDCVKWIGPRNNPYPYLTKSHVLISLSSTEACPMIFIESKILNVPIISADFLTADEFIVDGKDGFVVPIHSIKETLETIFKDARLYNSLKNHFDGYLFNKQSLEKFNTII